MNILHRWKSIVNNSKKHVGFFCAWPRKRISVCLHSFTSAVCLNVFSKAATIQVKKAKPQKNIFPGLVSKNLLSLG